jgi:hypothetical protein
MPKSIMPMAPVQSKNPSVDATERGFIAGTMSPYSQAIHVEAHQGASNCITILQGDTDVVCVNEAQLQWFLLALASAAKALNYKEYQ